MGSLRLVFLIGAEASWVGAGGQRPQKRARQAIQVIGYISQQFWELFCRGGGVKAVSLRPLYQIAIEPIMFRPGLTLASMSD